MTWNGTWQGSYNGSWFGEVVVVVGFIRGGGESQDNEEIVAVIMAFMVVRGHG